MTSKSHVALIAEQIGSTVMSDTDLWVNRFTVKSSSTSSTYTVAQRKGDGVWGCSCRGWINHRKCKHLTDVLHRLSELSTKEGFDRAAIEILVSARAAYLDLRDPTPVAAPKVTAPTLDL
jgi:hypothetical protein